VGVFLKIAVAAAGTVLILGVSGCSTSPDVGEGNELGNHLQTSHPSDEFLDDGSGNELEIGSDLTLPPTWPIGVPTPVGSLIAVSVIDEQTAVATWSVTGDVVPAQIEFLTLFDSGYLVQPIPDLSTESIFVYGAIGNGYDITISATVGEKSTDPGEITLLINPSS
jgi:hypothetical protein